MEVRLSRARGGARPWWALGRLVAVGSRTLLHFVFGHTYEEQTALQANSVGAIDLPTRSSQFDLGLALVVDGLRARVEAAVRA